MASTYSNLKFELIGTGDQSGTWGTTTNTNLGTAIEQAIVGMATISSGFTGSPLTLTLTLTDTNAAQNARALVLNLTQALGGVGVLNVPAIQKPYMIINATGQTVTVKVTGLTGVAVPTGTRAFLYNNGTDVGDFFNYASSLTLGTDLAIADGGTGASTAPNARTNLGATTVGSNLFTLTNPSAITFLRINADNTVSALDAATFRTAIGAGTTSGAAGSNTQVQYNNAGAFAGSSNLTFDGTSLTLGGNPTLSGGTANGVLYLNGSKVATSGSALTFDGATFIAPFVQASDANASVKADGNGVAGIRLYANSVGAALLETTTDTDLTFRRNSAEGMRLTSTGLGIGTSSPDVKLVVKAGNGNQLVLDNAGETYTQMGFRTGGTARGTIWATATDFSLYTYSTQPIIFWTNATERMRLDSSGNLGLGVTPSAWNSSYKAAQIGSTGVIYSTNNIGLAYNFYVDSGGTNRYLTTAAASVLLQDSGQFRFFTAPSGTAGDAITFTQAMTLDASGNLLVGKTSTALGTAGVEAQPVGYFAVTRAERPLVLNRLTTDGDLIELYRDSVSKATLGITSNALTFGVAGSERARIDSSGNLGIGLTPVADNGILQLNSYGAIKALIEGATVSATAATGTINYDAATQAVLYYTSNASANWTVNFRGSGSLSLNSMMQTGQSLTVAFLVTQGSTAYYNSAVQVDGSSVTPKWQGGTAPTSGNASSIDSYVYTIIKTGAATFTVLASQTKFA